MHRSYFYPGVYLVDFVDSGVVDLDTQVIWNQLLNRPTCLLPRVVLVARRMTEPVVLHTLAWVVRNVASEDLAVAAMHAVASLRVPDPAIIDS